jgi:hypothetical protein
VLGQLAGAAPGYVFERHRSGRQGVVADHPPLPGRNGDVGLPQPPLLVLPDAGADEVVERGPSTRETLPVVACSERLDRPVSPPGGATGLSASRAQQSTFALTPRGRSCETSASKGECNA